MTMRTILISAVTLAAPAFLAGQTMLSGPNVVFQQAGVLTGAIPAQGPVFFSSGALGPAVTGRPFSGTEQRHSLQVLGDGTRIERTDTDQYYRDSEGRTRVEQNNAQSNGSTTFVTISDPVAGFMLTLNPADKTARKMPLPPGLPGLAKTFATVGGAVLSTGGGTFSASAPDVNVAGQQRIEIRAAAGAAFGGNVALAPLPPGIAIVRNESKLDAVAPEDLGTQAMNGVSAQGSRTTLTIPAGQIGNDRELKVVSERWYSPDLQMTIKSVNNDPRFGETTFELTNINQAAPDPSLFLVPPDYTVSQPQTMEYKGAVLK
jgi:hypothetical protein